MAAILEYEYINIMRKTGLPAAISKQILRKVSVFALESQLKKERPCRWQEDHLDIYYAAESSRDWVNVVMQYLHLTLKVLVVTIDAQWEGMGDVWSARYEPALLPPCPTVRVLSYSNYM